jgi:multidrug efflux pump subunit AcrA (membrane-fusion protein)
MIVAIHDFSAKIAWSHPYPWRAARDILAGHCAPCAMGMRSAPKADGSQQRLDIVGPRHGGRHMRAIILAAFVWAYAPPAHSEGAAAVPVGVVQAELRPIAKTLDFVGRVDAINRVDIRARVKGYLEAVLFKEGDLVKEGQPLYRIEKGLFQAAVEQAQGKLQTGKAQHELAVKNRERQAELFAKNVSAGKQLDRRVGGGSEGGHHDK